MGPGLAPPAPLPTNPTPKSRGCGGERCEAYDTAQHQAYLHAPSPQVECPEYGIRQARLP